MGTAVREGGTERVASVWGEIEMSGGVFFVL